nr:MAG TPA: hypothetical protein [Caudoviricetes sp.]
MVQSVYSRASRCWLAHSFGSAYFVEYDAKTIEPINHTNELF